MARKPTTSSAAFLATTATAFSISAPRSNLPNSLPWLDLRVER